jgi:hypothetical protein
MKPSFIVAALVFPVLFAGCTATPEEDLLTQGDLVRAFSEISSCDDIEVYEYDGTGIAAYPEPYISVSCNRDVYGSVFESADDLEATARSVCGAVISGFPEGFRISENAVLTPSKIDAGSERVVPVVLAQMGLDDAPSICP